MDRMETICIMCPMGCSLTVESDGGNISVKGNTCLRGKVYGENEFTSPKRVVTSLVRLEEGGVVSVKTNGLIPKSMIGDILRTIKDVRVKKPVHIGDIIIKDVLNTGVDVVATSVREQ